MKPYSFSFLLLMLAGLATSATAAEQSKLSEVFHSKVQAEAAKRVKRPQPVRVLTRSVVKEQKPDSVISYYGGELSGLYLTNGEPYNKVAYTYDNEGFMLSEKQYTFSNGAWQLMGRKEVDPDFTGSILTTTYSDDGVTPEEREYNKTLDAYGSTEQIEERWIDGQWIICHKTIQRFDKDANLLLEEVYALDEDKAELVLEYSDSFTIGADGRITSETVYGLDDNGEPQSAELVYAYDEQGREVSVTCDIYKELTEYAADGTTTTSYYEREGQAEEFTLFHESVWNADGYIEERYYEDGTLIAKYIAQQTSEDGYTLLTETSYEIDEESEELMCSSRSISKYDASSNLVENQDQVWKEDAFKTVYVTTYIYQDGVLVQKQTNEDVFPGEGEWSWAGYTHYYYPSADNGINYRVYPSNKDIIEAYELKHLTFTFPDAQSVTIDDAFMSDNSKVEIFDAEGNRLYKSDCTAWYDDVWQTEGNQLYVDLSESFDKFTTSGNYVLVLSNIKVDDEPVKLEIPYQLNVKRMAPEEEATLITPAELDENNVLWLTYDTKNYDCYGYAINGIGIAYDANNNIVGLVSNHYKEIYTDAHRYGLEIMFYDDVDPTIQYHIDFDKGIFTLADPYGTCHETAATTAYFWKAGASAIDTIGLDEDSAVIYDLFGRQTSERQGFGLKNGKKLYQK